VGDEQAQRQVEDDPGTYSIGSCNEHAEADQRGEPTRAKVKVYVIWMLTLVSKSHILNK
jgi:hypothetical protein